MPEVGAGLMAKALQGYFATKRVVSEIGSSPQQQDGTIKGEETDQAVTKVPHTAMDVVALAGFGSSIVTMALTTGHIVDLASLTTLCLSPYAALQKRHLKKLGSLRTHQNVLREHVNTLHLENNKMKASVDKLEVNVDKLEVVEKELDKLAKDSKTSVDRLVHIVTENGKLQAQIKKKLEKQITQQVVAVVTQSDANRDFSISPQERDMLQMRLNLMPGFDLDQENFEKFCPKNKDVALPQIMRVLRNLVDDSVPEEENVFHLKPRQLLQT